MRKIILVIVGVLTFSVFSYKISFALFTSNAASTNNTFTAASQFPAPCVGGQAFAVSHQNITQGPKKDNSPITDPARIDPDKMLGAPDWVSGTGTNFFAMGKNGTLTLVFANPISPTGTDNLKIYEATNGRSSYPLEKAKIEVSINGSDWTELSPEFNSEPGGDGINIYDLSSPIKFVKLTETTDFGPHDNSWDGIDVDAIEGVINCTEVDQ